MKFYKTFAHVGLAATIFCSSCIMTKNPQYQSASSYLDARYNELLYLSEKDQLSLADLDEAYLLSAVYSEKKRWKEAKNLLKIVFNGQKTLAAGVEYIEMLKKVGDTKEADNVQKFLTVIYSEHEISDSQKNIVNNF